MGTFFVRGFGDDEVGCGFEVEGGEVDDKVVVDEVGGATQK